MFLYIYLALALLVVVSIILYSKYTHTKPTFDVYIENSDMTDCNKKVFISFYEMFTETLLDLYSVKNMTGIEKQEVNAVIDIEESISYCENVLNKKLFGIQKNFKSGDTKLTKAQQELFELKRNYANISKGLSGVHISRESIDKIYKRIQNKALVLNTPASTLLRGRASHLVEQSETSSLYKGECAAKLQVIDSKLDLQLYKRN